jgi:hypothetical protein
LIADQVEELADLVDVSRHLEPGDKLPDLTENRSAVSGFRIKKSPARGTWSGLSHSGTDYVAKPRPRRRGKNRGSPDKRRAPRGTRSCHQPRGGRRESPAPALGLVSAPRLHSEPGLVHVAGHSFSEVGADGGSRTLTALRPQDFKSCVSTSSTTSAFRRRA